MPPPLSGNKATKISALKIPAIFAQKSAPDVPIIPRKASLTNTMGNKNSTKKNENNQTNGISHKKEENSPTKNPSQTNGISSPSKPNPPKIDSKPDQNGVKSDKNLFDQNANLIQTNGTPEINGNKNTKENLGLNGEGKKDQNSVDASKNTSPVSNVSKNQTETESKINAPKAEIKQNEKIMSKSLSENPAKDDSKKLENGVKISNGDEKPEIILNKKSIENITGNSIETKKNFEDKMNINYAKTDIKIEKKEKESSVNKEKSDSQSIGIIGNMEDIKGENSSKKDLELKPDILKKEVEISSKKLENLNGKTESKPLLNGIKKEIGSSINLLVKAGSNTDTKPTDFGEKPGLNLDPIQQTQTNLINGTTETKLLSNGIKDEINIITKSSIVEEKTEIKSVENSESTSVLKQTLKTNSATTENSNTNSKISVENRNLKSTENISELTKHTKSAVLEKQDVGVSSVAVKNDFKTETDKKAVYISKETENQISTESKRISENLTEINEPKPSKSDEELEIKSVEKPLLNPVYIPKTQTYLKNGTTEIKSLSNGMKEEKSSATKSSTLGEKIELKSLDNFESNSVLQEKPQINSVTTQNNVINRKISIEKENFKTIESEKISELTKFAVMEKQEVGVNLVASKNDCNIVTDEKVAKEKMLAHKVTPEKLESETISQNITANQDSKSTNQLSDLQKVSDSQHLAKTDNGIDWKEKITTGTSNPNDEKVDRACDILKKIGATLSSTEKLSPDSPKKRNSLGTIETPPENKTEPRRFSTDGITEKMAELKRKIVQIKEQETASTLPNLELEKAQQSKESITGNNTTSLINDINPDSGLGAKLQKNITTTKDINKTKQSTSLNENLNGNSKMKKEVPQKTKVNKVVTIIRKEVSSKSNIKPQTVRQTSIDSNYGSLSTIQTSPSASSICSTDTIVSNSNYESISSGTSSYYDTARSQTQQLPPPAPTRKQLPMRRAATAPVPNISEKSTKAIVAHLQTRPLRNKNSPRRSSTPNNDNVTTGRLTISRSPSPSPSTSRSRANSYSRSVSPSCSTYSRPSISRSRCSSSPTPRRIFPQVPSKANLDEIMNREQAPVVFDANLSFVIGCKSQIRQNVVTTPSHMDATTASNYLTSKICDFLKRTDHVMDEWKGMGHRGDDENDFPRSEEERRILGKSKSAANIAIKGYTLFSKDRSSSLTSRNSIARSRSNSTVRDLITDDCFSEYDELSEMTADLAEEHSTATLAGERLDAETSERIRLERELSEVQNKNKTLHQTSERLEMELLYARSDLNGAISEEDEEDEDSSSVYKGKYERAIRELEFTRRRLQQQHEDDLEQLVGLKKQLEKKLSDAYEEVEEQRQVVGQWKRKVQKLTSDLNDMRLLLKEQNARNNLLEKKQRKFDAETQLLNDELRQEKQQRERLSREKDLILAEKYTLENNLADVRLELELKEERLNSLQQEYNDLTFGGKSDDEVAAIRKQKQDCERRLHEQEEELDDLAGQVQMLEQAKVRLEMSLEQQRKESRREIQQRDDELEEVRCNAQKKVKALESQLENEHEERTLLLREKHSLERRLAALTEAGRSEREGDEAYLQKLKKDLRRTKALLRDAQTMLERNKADSPSKAVIRQLRNQLDDTEFARAAAVKAKQSLESELSDIQSQLDEANRHKAETEDRANQANRERTDLRTQLEENEEELAEVLKKYRSTVQQLSTDQLALQEQVSLVSDLEAERNSLKEQLSELTTKLESIETMGDPSSSAQVKRMELRVKELESKLEFEQTSRARLEVQVTRLKETLDKLQTELAVARTKEQQAQDNLRKTQRSLREIREEHAVLKTREAEAVQKRKELEKKIESSDAETSATKADLRLALQRIEDLQAAIQGELEDTPSDHSDSDGESYSSDDSIGTFLTNNKISPVKSDKTINLDTSSSLRNSATDSFA